MIGSIKWNMNLALVAMILTFGLSLSNNAWTTSFMRAIYAFMILFIVTFAIRFVLGTIAGMKNLATEAPAAEAEAGQSIDVATPNDDDAINNMLKQQLAGDSQPEAPVFEPLNPQRLVTKKEQIDSERMARSLREMSEE